MHLACVPCRCLQGCVTSQACHAHVAQCGEKPPGADVYYPREEYAAFQARRRAHLVQAQLDELPAGQAGHVFDALRPQLAGLDVVRPGVAGRDVPGDAPAQVPPEDMEMVDAGAGA